uniref:Uncharacterized protein n=1 Tax=Anguilla anguilla TaxID=7936 RepID=A0A0E9VL00_ANGAN
MCFSLLFRAHSDCFFSAAEFALD